MATTVVSSYFVQTSPKLNSPSLCDEFLHYIDELNSSLDQYKPPSKVDCVYNPTVYARETFEMYITRYCNTKKPIMYLGMNPGPWGMSQTGVPFGEVNSVKNWLQIQGPVNKPPQTNKARPVKGFECTRSEASGKKFWGLFKTVCWTPDKFFQSSFVYNYLPQQWMDLDGRNLTPGDFKVSDTKQLYNICDPILNKVIALYEVQTIIAVGKFCETRAKKVIENFNLADSIKILYMPHPSPRTVNNNDWEKKAFDFLESNDLLQYYK